MKTKYQVTEKPSTTIFDKSITTRELIFIAVIILCLSPLISPPIALLLGLLMAQFVGHPYLHLNHKATQILLQISVVGLGFGMNVNHALKIGREGFGLTVLSISCILTIGYFLGKFLKIEKKTAYLISVGTAICGGSAIAAISPVIKAEEKQISVALGCIFILNAAALFIFPVIGHSLNLSQTQFGLWCALAIHDTSSVIGAASKFGIQALETAATVKLARALWIIPIALISSALFKTKGSRIKIPYFIGLFVLGMVASTYIPWVQQYSHYITKAATSGLTLTLFLIGCGLSKQALLAVGYKPLLLGVIIWAVISAGALLVIMQAA